MIFTSNKCKFLNIIYAECRVRIVKLENMHYLPIYLNFGNKEDRKNIIEFIEYY